MANLLSTYISGRNNNFNLMRFIAASLVLFSHSFALTLGSSDFEPMKLTLGITWGSIAVDIFFVTSGFLITSSFLSSKNLIAFAWARILRIYPALIVAMAFCILIGAWFTTHTTQEYFSNTQTYKYFIKNTILFWGIEYKLPGVFLDVPAEGAINGSLWTLPYEVKMYAILASILVFITYINQFLKFLTIKHSILLIGVISIGLHILNHFNEILPIHFIRLFSMFFIGATFFLWRDSIYLSSKWFIGGVITLLLASFNKDGFFVIYCLTLPIIIFFIAYVPEGRIRMFNKLGDYSYGIYIYAFPVQQSIIAIAPNISVSTMIALSFLITLFLAILSWHLIEKKCLKMKGATNLIENIFQEARLTKLFKQVK